MRAGASGYIGKDACADEMLLAVNRLLSGRLYLSENMAEHVLSLQMRGQAFLKQPDEACLSDREVDVFSLLGRGLSTRRIAGRLHLSSKTIDTHKEHIKSKLGIADNTALIQRAVIWLMSQQSG